MAANQPLAALAVAGTSPWLDQLRRSMIEGGELQRMVDEDSLLGVTSNPTIFEKAILGSPDYDDELQAGAREGLGARELYRRIAVRDVQLAADVLRPVYEGTDGQDGFVSLEVAPRLAHETEGTLEQARHCWGLVDRPNLMIKIPATEAGIGAIEAALYEGMHVNVTLLFSVEAYRRVMDAHLRAMERRHADGRPLDRHSVASFFVSRVDTEVDRRLEAIGRPELAGRAGLANARAAYRAFQEVYGGERFAALRDAGCPVQRLLWASTGVKNPHYPETMYVDGLVAPDTVNTMPRPTLLAFAEHGDPHEGSAAIDPAPDLRALAEAGVDLEDVTTQLLREGIEAFMTPMAKLLDGIERRREAVVTGHPTVLEADLPPELESPIADRMQAAAEADVAKRIWRKDATLWAAEGTAEVADRLGWLTIGDKMLEDAAALREFADECQAAGLTDCVLLGMGGSSLAPEVFRRSFGQAPRGLRLHVLDSTEPLAIAATRDAVDLSKTLFLVSTKSGATIETRTLFEYFHGLEPDGSHYAAVTDPGSALLELADEHGFRRAFVNDPDIGGRYSALSYFGLVPAALAGIDIEAVLQSSAVAEQNCAYGNSGLWLGVALGELALCGRDKLTLLLDPPLESFGLWVEQLVAESTGKAGTGILPVAGEPPLDLDAYGDDRVFVHLRNAGDGGDAEHAARLAALAAAGHPTITGTFSRPEDLGRLFFFAEFAAAVAGWVLGINPFDQPDVQESDDATRRVLDEGPPRLEDGDLGALTDGGLAPPHHLAIIGFLPSDGATDAAVGRLRRVVAERHGVATTFGYGPRCLHSTGQLHKGGPKLGHFLQLVHDAGTDLEIPGRGFGFRALVAAQADGDLQTLRRHGVPAVRVRLPASDVPGAIDALTERI